jgi:hypothetical protein
MAFGYSRPFAGFAAPMTLEMTLDANDVPNFVAESARAGRAARELIHSPLEK